MFFHFIYLDLKTAWRAGLLILHPLLIMLLSISLVGYTLSHWDTLLSPAVISCLLSTLVVICLSLRVEEVLTNGINEGYWEALILHTNMMRIFVAARVIGWWLIQAVPISILAAIILQLLCQDYGLAYALSLSLLTFTLCSLGTLISSLQRQATHATLVLMMMMIPLIIPGLICHLAFVEAILTLQINFDLLNMQAGLALLSFGGTMAICPFVIQRSIE